MLKAQDPRRHQRRIAQLEQQLNDRARELAERRKKYELSLFPLTLHDVAVVSLTPHDDNEFATLA